MHGGPCAATCLGIFFLDNCLGGWWLLLFCLFVSDCGGCLSPGAQVCFGDSGSVGPSAGGGGECSLNSIS